MKTKHHLLIAALLLLPAWAVAQSITSAVPGTISYQGRVLNNSGGLVGAGTPVNRTVIFRIWDHPSNTLTGNLLYSEQQTVTISEGEFSVLVGQGAATSIQTFGYSETAKGPPTVSLPNAFGGATRYLGVTVAAGTTIQLTDNEITPRQQIVGSAFAFRARFAESVGSNGNTALTALNGGQVGIGNTNPPSLFTVTGATTSTTTNTPQMIITDSGDTNERLLFGVNSTGNGTGFIQATKVGTGAQNLLLNPNGGNVGIGITTAPTTKLDVNGGIKASGAGGYTFNSGDIDGGLFSPANGILTLLTNNTERMRIDGSGKVGLGTSPSAGAALTVDGGSAIEASNGNGDLIIGPRTGEHLSLGHGHSSGTGLNMITSFNNNTQTDMFLNYWGNGGVVYLTGSGTSSKVSVGTTGVTEKFNVGGNAHISGNIYANNRIGIGTTGPGGLIDIGVQGWGNSAVNIRARTSDDIIMNVWRRTNATGGGGAGSECFRMEDWGGTGFIMQVMQGSANKPGGGSWGAYSDIRLKNNIQSLEGALPRLLQLRSVSFEYKDVPESGGLKGSQIGFIAQEVEKVFPQWITTSSSGYKVVNITGFESLTVQAFREMKSELEAQTEQLQKLQKELAAQIQTNDEAEKKTAAMKTAHDVLVKRLALLEARDKARDAKIAAIEALLTKDKPTALPVTLRKSSGGAE